MLSPINGLTKNSIETSADPVVVAGGCVRTSVKYRPNFSPNPFFGVPIAACLCGTGGGEGVVLATCMSLLLDRFDHASPRGRRISPVGSDGRFLPIAPFAVAKGDSKSSTVVKSKTAGSMYGTLSGKWL